MDYTKETLNKKEEEEQQQRQPFQPRQLRGGRLVSVREVPLDTPINRERLPKEKIIKKYLYSYDNGERVIGCMTEYSF
ncbi:hypothetical protein CHUAL_004342 [Chamberlinius hualienensis]